MATEKKNDGAADKKAAAKLLGRLGGLKGGPARAEALSPAKRTAIAVLGGESKRDGRASGSANRSKMNEKKPDTKKKK